MSTELRLSVLARVTALAIALSLPAALIGCAPSMAHDDSYFLGANHGAPVVTPGVGVAG